MMTVRTLLISGLLAISGSIDANAGSPSVLLIGDSNTENGLITAGLRDALVAVYGNQGSGYFPLMDTLNGRLMGFAGPTPGITMSIDTSWQRLDMRYMAKIDGKMQNKRLTEQPFLSPHGIWIESKRLGARTTVTFTGSGIDLHFLKRPGAGSFGVSVDGEKISTVATAGERVSAKTSIAGLEQKQHTMTVTVESGTVILQGVDSRARSSTAEGRAVVHTWGNGFASTTDYSLIDQMVFESALRELDPSAVVVLLGTNDHYADAASSTTVRTNLTTILSRAKRALPGKGILLASTFFIGNKARTPDSLLTNYLANAYPQAAAAAGVQYWDMAKWYGPYDASYMQDYLHCNAAGGARIGTQLWKELQGRFGYSSDVRAPRQVTKFVPVRSKQEIAGYLVNGIRITGAPARFAPIVFIGTAAHPATTSRVGTSRPTNLYFTER